MNLLYKYRLNQTVSDEKNNVVIIMLKYVCVKHISAKKRTVPWCRTSFLIKYAFKLLHLLLILKGFKLAILNDMMRLSDILIDPKSNKKLILDKKNQRISNIDPKQFIANVEKDIIVILPRTKVSGPAESEFHTANRSEFNYTDHYQKDAEVFDYFKENDNKVIRDENHRLHQNILSAVPDKASMVLDVGCGGGWLSEKLVNENRAVISMDISSVNPSKAIQKWPHKNHFALVADVYRLPISEESLDCIVAAEIIEHVPDTQLFIKNLLRPLKKGGQLIITTPHNQKIKYHLCVHCNKQTPASGHLHSFNENNVKDIVPENVADLRFKLFMNKYFIKSRLSLIMKFLPFKMWELLDRIANNLFKNSLRLMIIITK